MYGTTWLNADKHSCFALWWVYPWVANLLDPVHKKVRTVAALDVHPDDDPSVLYDRHEASSVKVTHIHAVLTTPVKPYSLECMRKEN